jgi:hypothetical protein
MPIASIEDVLGRARDECDVEHIRLYELIKP